MGRKKNPDPLYWEKRRARPKRTIYTCAWCELPAAGQTWCVRDGQRWHADCRAEYETLLPLNATERVAWWQTHHHAVCALDGRPRLIAEAEAVVAATTQRQAHLALRDFWLRPSKGVNHAGPI